MKKNDWILIIAVILYSWMFYQQAPGINYLIFSVAAIGLLIWREPSTLKDGRWYVAASGTIVSAVCVTLFGNQLSVLANVVSLSLMSAFSLSKRSSVILAGIYAMYSYVSSVGFMIADLVKRRGGNGATRGSRFWIRLGIGVGILAILILFFVLYQRSNPLFLDLTRKIKLDFISWPWVRFTFLGFLLLYGFFYHRNFPAWLRWDVAHAVPLDRDKIMGGENRIFGRVVNVKWEVSSGVVLLVLLNLLLLVVNSLDIYYLWITGELPTGMTYSDYVHQGTTNMIISIAIAILIILFFFRGHMNFVENNKAIKAMAVIWIIQNIVVLISTGYRNYLYVAEYSLTYRRIGVYIWLALTLVGLVTTFYKIYAKKSNWYLFRANGWAFYIILVLFACQNWDLVITKFNIQQSIAKGPSFKLDKYYLLSLESPAVIPELLKLGPDQETTLPVVPEEFEKSFKASEVRGREYDMPYYRPDFNEELNRRMYEFITEYKDNGWQSWNYQDEKTFEQINDLSNTGIFTKLSLTNMQLDSLQFVNVFNKLTSLDLSNNHITDFDALTEFSQLEELNLSSNALTTTQNLPEMPALRKLWLSNNSISDYNGVTRYPKLEYLNVANNYGGLDLKTISSLKGLKELDVSSNNVEDYSLLKNFSSLNALYLKSQQNTDFSTLPALPTIEKLDISGNYLGNDNGSIQKFFGGYAGLKELSSSNNGLVSIFALTDYYKIYNSLILNSPDTVEALFPKLEKLDLSNNNITDLDAIVYYLNLKELDVASNSISSLSGVNNLHSLTKLDISGNQVVILDSLKGLDQLRELNISNTSVTNIEALASLKNLEVLTASGCQIASYSCLKDLPKLKVLILSNNYFTDLSFAKDLKTLEVLCISGNTSIEDFSPLYGLKNLKALYLDSYISDKLKRELEEKLPGVRISYGYYDPNNYYDSEYKY